MCGLVVCRFSYFLPLQLWFPLSIIAVLGVCLLMRFSWNLSALRRQVEVERNVTRLSKKKTSLISFYLLVRRNSLFSCKMSNHVALQDVQPLKVFFALKKLHGNFFVFEFLSILSFVFHNWRRRLLNVGKGHDVDVWCFSPQPHKSSSKLRKR